MKIIDNPLPKQIRLILFDLGVNESSQLIILFTPILGLSVIFYPLIRGKHIGLSTKAT